MQQLVLNFYAKNVGKRQAFGYRSHFMNNEKDKRIEQKMEQFNKFQKFLEELRDIKVLSDKEKKLNQLKNQIK